MDQLKPIDFHEAHRPHCSSNPRTFPYSPSDNYKKKYSWINNQLNITRLSGDFNVLKSTWREFYHVHIWISHKQYCAVLCKNSLFRLHAIHSNVLIIHCWNLRMSCMVTCHWIGARAFHYVPGWLVVITEIVTYISSSSKGFLKVFNHLSFCIILHPSCSIIIGSWSSCIQTYYITIYTRMVAKRIKLKQRLWSL